MSARKHGYFRRPRTTQERRWNEAHRKYVRGRRSPKLLPTTWDDMYKSSVDSRSWKDKFKKRRQWEDAPYQTKWNLRLGYWVTPNCRNENRKRNERYYRLHRCPGCPVCHKRNTWRK